MNGDLWAGQYNGQSGPVPPASGSEVESVFPGKTEGSNWQLPRRSDYLRLTRQPVVTWGDTA